MKLTPVATRFGGINDDRYIGLTAFRLVILGVSLGDTDHYGIIILGFLVGVMHWTDEEWEEYLLVR